MPKSVMALTALLWMQQHAFDHLRGHIVGLHVFDRANRIETRLHGDATFDDGAASFVVPLLIEVIFRDGFQTGGQECVHHDPLQGVKGHLIPIKVTCKESMSDSNSKSMSGSYYSEIKILLVLNAIDTRQ